jgi:hypothetical protein
VSTSRTLGAADLAGLETWDSSSPVADRHQGLNVLDSTAR